MAPRINPSKNQKAAAKKNGIEKIRRRLKAAYLRLLRLNDPPEMIARGAAIGVFMGIFPTFGVGAILAIALAYILKANKAAAVIGSLIMNPFFAPFFWTVSAVVGGFIFRVDSSYILSKIHDNGFIRGALSAYLVFLAGNAIVSAVFALGTYYLLKKAITRHRARKSAGRL